MNNTTKLQKLLNKKKIKQLLKIIKQKNNKKILKNY